MTTDTAAAHPFRLRIARDRVLGILVAAAMLASSIVFVEPAPVDALFAAIVVALCLLGGGRIGSAGRFGLICWLAVVAAGFVAAPLSPDLGGAIKHQAITLFLALAGAALAAYIAADPEPRAKLILNWYVAGTAIACILAYVGYFKLLPGAHELFTNFDRARGPFKDPNVLGAAICPAIIYLSWLIARLPLNRTWLPALIALAMMPALLLSFSRGAWLSLAVSLVLLAYLAMLRTRRRSDTVRVMLFLMLGALVTAFSVIVALQSPSVGKLLEQRATLTQVHDEGPHGRFGGQLKAVRLVGQNPLGIGTHTFREAHHHEEVHNVYLSMFLNGGWLAGLFYLASIALTLVLGLRGALRPGRLQFAYATAFAAFVGMAVEGLVIDSDHWRHFFIVMALIWGLADASTPAARPYGRRSTDKPAMRSNGGR